jgi:hypothetical protein
MCWQRHLLHPVEMFKDRLLTTLGKVRKMNIILGQLFHLILDYFENPRFWLNSFFIFIYLFIYLFISAHRAGVEIVPDQETPHTSGSSRGPPAKGDFFILYS